MKTIVYLIRHSGPNIKTNIISTDSTFQETNEKYVLTQEGEQRASLLAQDSNLQNIDYIISSHYVRAMATAKYIADKNNLLLDIDSSLGERKFGFSKYEDMPERFYERQQNDPYYKFGNGENQLEVNKRMTHTITDIIKKHKGEKIVIVSHNTAISFYLKNWCHLEKEEDKYVLKYQDKILVFGNMNAPEAFELVFEDEDLLDISLKTPKILQKKNF